jgi:hypothetical protein
MPIGKLVTVGVWEDSKWIGCVIFGRGANNALGKKFELLQTEVCELVRIALRHHTSSVSRIVSIALLMLKKLSPGLRMVVSYADPREGHIGGIYQAGNWLYCGVSDGSKEFFHDGRWKHNREVTAGAFGGNRKLADYSKLATRNTPGKHKYLMPLDNETRRRIESLRQPYPKRPKQTGDAAAFPAEEGGSTPTRTLQSKAGFSRT